MNDIIGTIAFDDSPLPGAAITVAGPNLSGERTTVSNADGNYAIAALPPGDYTVRVELEGLETVTRQTRVDAGATARVDVALTLAPFPS